MPADLPQYSDYPYVQPVTLRWQDNDLRGHVHSAAYYSFFDSTVNAWLVERGGVDLHEGPCVAWVVSSACDYFSSLSYPAVVEVGLRVTRLSGSTVEFELAVFRVDEPEPCAVGRIVQVLVDRQTGQPVVIPDPLRVALKGLQPS
ncbi:thioesterase family protein [Pseudomonas sp. DTU_2021_1001937_2_SI_NGA_ILE_001]|uniref:acyl-CoA thioesterase n=1 Tax=Pseudomonas sp. DTU_2021_1001937_2_SI_NGA_ILE_001 TaxID=3077589 RepID=UPI0025DA8B97|nr:thioesterase family protein [Pseudomonas sp. DTU_2021_1001937_2_SI_NGA_ILE_001]WNW12448.1 thioesterase family protein [Pseudomonas sp. DTU_2021_1001937_2_SI_NGA_ILE_001]